MAHPTIVRPVPEPEDDDQAPRALPDDQAPLRQGILPGLMARVGTFGKAPPERALWREVLTIAIDSSRDEWLTTPRGTFYVVNGYQVRIVVVVAVGGALYFHSEQAGFVGHWERRKGEPPRLHGYGIRELAEFTHAGERSVRAALVLFKRWGIVRSERPNGRREPALLRLNVGGLDWPAVRARAKVEIEAQAAARDQARLEDPEQLALMDVQGVGLVADTQVRAVGPDRTQDVRAVGPDRTTWATYGGLRTSGSTAVAGTSRANSADRWCQEQQQRNQARIEGLIGAISSRARRLGHDFDETDERRRLADGEIDVAALQALADDLDLELADRGDVRLHRITHGMNHPGGVCAVCGRQAPSATEFCPGRPRRTRILALAEDCAPAATTGTAPRAG